VGSALALSHVILFFAIMSRHYEGSWGGFLIFLVDFPGSILPLLLSNALGIGNLHPLLVFGTVWWFCIGILISKAFTFFSAKVEKDSGSAVKQR
jgi:hypothetical protein